MDIFSYMLGRKSGGGSGGGGGGGSNEDWVIGDGNTHLWITLPEGKTSPMLGVCPNGTVTVDWGDGSTPDVLTGTNTNTSASNVRWTPNHEYAAAGDYVISLTVNGQMTFYNEPNTIQSGPAILRHSSSASPQNQIYQSALRKIEIGSGITSIGVNAFAYCTGLTDVVISNGVKYVDQAVFQYCSSLTNVTIPDSVTSIATNAFAYCISLTNVVISNGVTSIGNNAFRYCSRLAHVTIPDSVKSMNGYMFAYCNGLISITIPDSITSISNNAFQNCTSLTSITIPNGVTSISSTAFQYCTSLTSIKIPSSVMSIGGNVFQYSYNIQVYDFTTHTAVPSLSSTSAFADTSKQAQIRVPAALVDEWKAATNWSTYADYIVGV